MAGETIKEFLVALGFDVNETQFKKFTGAVGAATLPVVKLGVAVATTATAIEVMVERISRQFEELYYAAQRGHTTASSLLAIGYAAKQVGLDAKAGMNLVDQLARTLRMDPTAESFINQLGVHTRDGNDNLLDTAKVLNDIEHTMAKWPRWIALMLAGSRLGLDPDTFNRFLDNLPQSDKAGAEAKKRQADYGFDPDKAATQFNDFAKAVNRLEDQIETLAYKTAQDWLPVANAVVATASRAVEWFGKWNSQNYGGLIGDLIALGGALGGVAAALKVISAIPYVGWVAKLGLSGLGLLARFGVVGGVAAAGYVALHAGGLNEGEVDPWDAYLASRAGPRAGNVPLGIADNNPGNLYDNRPGHETKYPTALAGLTALSRDILIKYNRGLDTVDKILTAYGGNDPNFNEKAYARDVTGKTGFAPGEHLDFNNPAVLEKFLAAVVMHENRNQNPYSSDLYRQAIAGSGISIVQNNRTEFNVVGSDPATTARMVNEDQTRLQGDFVRQLAGSTR